MIVSQLLFMSYHKRASDIQYANRQSNIYSCSTKTATSLVLFRIKTRKREIDGYCWHFLCSNFCNSSATPDGSMSVNKQLAKRRMVVKNICDTCGDHLVIGIRPEDVRGFFLYRKKENKLKNRNGKPSDLSFFRLCKLTASFHCQIDLNTN